MLHARRINRTSQYLHGAETLLYSEPQANSLDDLGMDDLQLDDADEASEQVAAAAAPQPAAGVLDNIRDGGALA